jgi:hypothetical protein
LGGDGLLFVVAFGEVFVGGGGGFLRGVSGGGCESGSESVTISGSGSALFFELVTVGDVSVGDVGVVVLLVCYYFW